MGLAQLLQRKGSPGCKTVPITNVWSKTEIDYILGFMGVVYMQRNVRVRPFNCSNLGMFRSLPSVMPCMTEEGWRLNERGI